MIELTIYGRGGQGGVTLAKLIATSYFLRGKDVQAFGVYAAERAGAPVQAFVRIDDEEITNHNQVTRPDHVIVLDRTLIGPRVLEGLKPHGWLILNTPQSPDDLVKFFGGRQVATIGATRIAVENRLGTRAVPIVNTTMMGAVGRVLGLSLDDTEAGLANLQFGGSNLSAMRHAYESVVTACLPGKTSAPPTAPVSGKVAGLRDEDVGAMPRIHTGDWANRQPRRRTLMPPCNEGCPAGNDVQRFIARLAEEDYNAALATLLERSPLPGVCGRVCPAPCMEVCNRRLFDDSVNIRDLERCAATYGIRPEPTTPHREETVAVVGSGPAGLSAAYHLGRLGYPVTLYERDDDLGGVLRTGIPRYRLPPDILDAEIKYIVAHGVNVRTGECVDKTALLRLSREHAAIIVGTGLQRMRALDLGPGADGVVLQGLEFLNTARNGGFSFEGQQVVVVGGGNTAFDAARTARRLGARGVRIVYRRTRDEMPAIREEIDEAIAEGIRIDELVSPTRLHYAGAGPVLTCTRMKLGEPDESGRPRPVPEVSEDAHFEIRSDRVILALGQSADQSILPEGSEIRSDHQLLGLTGAPLFFCGDFSTNEGTVAAAIGSGRITAWHVHRTLAGEDLFLGVDPPVATPEDITTHVFTPAKQHEGAAAPARFRVHSFTEVRKGFVLDPVHTDDENEAVAEARRCFSCGVCNTCDRCLTHCPEGVVLREGCGYRFEYDYCKGCGICASECPRGVIYMAEL